MYASVTTQARAEEPTGKQSFGKFNQTDGTCKCFTFPLSMAVPAEDVLRRLTFRDSTLRGAAISTCSSVGMQCFQR